MGRTQTYRTAFQHTPTNLILRGEAEALILQLAVGLAKIIEIHAALGRHSPVLNEFQHLLFHISIQGSPLRREERHKIIHKLARRNFRQKMGAAILHARIG